MKRILTLCFLFVGLACFTGCPDYSHLREVPDYENMTDGGGEGSVPENEKD